MTDKKSVNLLPEFLRTDKNSKFLSSTIDPLIYKPQLERIDGYIGSKITPNYDPTTDFYLNEKSFLREKYSLEPALVFKNSTAEITDIISYDDLINEIKNQGGNVDNLDNVFRSKFYSYDPPIDWDKLINYSEYYWLPRGPETIFIKQSVDVKNEILGKTSWTFSHQFSNGEIKSFQLTNGMLVLFENASDILYKNIAFVVEGVGNSIELIDFTLLEAQEELSRVYNEVYDEDSFDIYPFDGSDRLPQDPEYVTINKASKDLNPWTRYNRWFHGEVIRITSEITENSPTVYPVQLKAQRPIIEFKPNLQLYNFGKRGIRNVDLIDNDTIDAMAVVDGSFGYYVDGRILEKGQRVIFNADNDANVRGKVFVVDIDVQGTTTILRLIPSDEIILNLDSVSINYGIVNSGKSFYFNENNKTWTEAQQHQYINQAPLFDLFDLSGNSYTELAGKNNFTGNKLFGYAIGTGCSDSVLGFPLATQNSVGVGSYLFNNYFIEDTILISKGQTVESIPTRTTYIKDNSINTKRSLFNVWNENTEDYPIPIIEIQTVTTSTSTVEITSINKPLTNDDLVVAYVNTIKRSYSYTGTNAVVFNPALTVNDTVLFKIFTTQKPNVNGFYEAPIGLTNNPLNEPIANMTFSELSDHVSTMVGKITNNEFKGKYPGTSNLRDIANYGKYGSRILINSNPLAFAQFFLAKKEHNVIDAIREAADQYNLFKMTMLKAMLSIDEKSEPSDALDQILAEINKNKSSGSSHYRSDMIGFGSNKIVRTEIISDLEITEYPIGTEFDLTTLSNQSILIYYKRPAGSNKFSTEQLLVGKDYKFNKINSSIILQDFLIPRNIGDQLVIVQYVNTLGSYVPATPTKLGMYPKYYPELYDDDSYADGSVKMIRGHDGSTMVAYNDYRDAIILEYEKRIYNNIKVEYNNKIFDVISVLPGIGREQKYTLENVNSILLKDFVRWSGSYGIDYILNKTYKEETISTWNLKNSFTVPILDTGTNIVIPSIEVSGTQRGVYRYFYDTEYPHLRPWEMLGFGNRPDWWIDAYGAGPYNSDNRWLWDDLAKGYVRGTGETLTRYARPGLDNFETIDFSPEPPRIRYVNAPVDQFGNLKSIVPFLIEGVSDSDKQEKWSFGDYGPAETAWRKSSYYPFVLNILSALLDPCAYTSRMYDLSRTKLNSIGQITYFENDVYLDLRKLIINGYENQQTAGFSVFITEKGLRKNQNYLNVLKQDLEFLDFNLFHKVGGFVSKEKLQINIDAIDPVSRSPGVVLPPEDYTLLLNVSNPVNTLSISGIIIQKSNGKFIVRGYDKANPYFEVLKPVKAISSGALTVGGVSEPFVEWTSDTGETNKGLTTAELTTAVSASTRYYKQGQLVRYAGKYYRAKVGHSVQSIFDPSLWQVLSALPVKGGATVQLPIRFETQSVKIPYGLEYTDIQEIYDLIIGYGAWLEKQGFIFDQFNTDLNEIVNWKFSAKEFLFWTTQNWADNNLITVSPFAEYLKFQSNEAVVDNIVSEEYGYELLKTDGRLFPIDKFSLSREEGICTITTVDTLEGIFFAKLRLIQKEHGMVFNNTTIFNDTIYDRETGYKQARMKLSGFRTSNWNGDFLSPGFVYDNVKIEDWVPFKSYLPGNVVRYNSIYYQANQKITGSDLFNFTEWSTLKEKPVPDLIPNFDYKINQFEDFYSLDTDNFDAGQQQLAQHLIGYTPRSYLNDILFNPISQYKFYQGLIKEKGTKNVIDKLSKASSFNRLGNITFNEEWAFRIGHYGSFSSYDEIEFKLIEGSYLENPYIVKFINGVPCQEPNPLINYVEANEFLIRPDNYLAFDTFVTDSSTYDENNNELLTAGYVRLEDVTATAFSKNSLLDIANNDQIEVNSTIWLGFLENGDWDVYRYTLMPAQVVGVYVSAPSSEITFVTSEIHGLNVGDIVSVVKFNDQVNGVYRISAVRDLYQFAVESTLGSIQESEVEVNGLLYKFESARYADLAAFSQAKNLFRLPFGTKFWVDRTEIEKWKVYEKVKNYSTSTFTANYNGKKLGHSISTNEKSNYVLVSAPGAAKVLFFKKNHGSLEKLFEYGLGLGDASTEFGYSLAQDETKNLYFAGAPNALPLGRVRVISNNNGQEQFRTMLSNPGSNTRFGNSIYLSRPNSWDSNILLIGAPGGTGKVYAYTVSLVNNNLSITPRSIPTISSTSSVVLNANSGWGTKIVGDKWGNNIAISAPGWSSGTYQGLVQIFDNNLHWKQTIKAPYNTGDQFAQDIAISNSGNYLIISSIDKQPYSQSFGEVYIYKLNDNNQYGLVQVIKNPLVKSNSKFGYSVSISDNDNILTISSTGDVELMSEFDITNETLFDSDSTLFSSIVKETGTVYVFNRIGSYFIPCVELNEIGPIENNKYGSFVLSNDDAVYVGSPSVDDAIDSTIYQFNVIDPYINGYNILRCQDDSVNVKTIRKVALIDSVNEQIVDYLDIIDPVKGKIAGIAEKEIKYKSTVDPAIYSIGIAGTVNNTEINWLDEHVGELWWDISTAKYIWYEQGDELFRRNNWGRLFPGASIDVYEWVKSDLLPSEWAIQADTNEGLTKGISGQPKYPDNSVVSVKQVYNNVTGAFENVYYFWVKNKALKPNNIKNRNLNALQVASLIVDPLGNGLRFIEVLTSDTVAFANVQPILIKDRISVNIAVDKLNSDIPKHTEWLLIEENNPKSMPNKLLEKKLIDSLLGRDPLGNVVPSRCLTYRNRYGLGIRPQQTLFKNRFEALRNIVEFSNLVLEKNLITGNYNFDNLNKKDEIPNEEDGLYDLVYQNNVELLALDTENFIRADLECFVYNGKLKSVKILDPGYGYSTPPTVKILGTNISGKIKTEIDSEGRIIKAIVEDAGRGYTEVPKLSVRPHTVIITSDSAVGNKWSMNEYNYETKTWARIKTQSFDTTLYWEYIDWQKSTYNPFRNISYIVADPAELARLTGPTIGDYVKVQNFGDGRFIILEKTTNGDFSESYNLVYSEKGTIRIKDSIWNPVITTTDYGKINLSNYISEISDEYGNFELEDNIYDQIPELEVYYLMISLKDDLFIKSLKVNWNLLFFVAVKYALTEQKLLDWAFKTSFINVQTDFGDLDQRPVYKLDNNSSFEQYIAEIKPYRTKVRNYVSKYSTSEGIEEIISNVIDFDLSPHFNTLTNIVETIGLDDDLINSVPWKDWKDNYKYGIKEILIADPGSGYVQRPEIIITSAIGDTGSGAAAEAYIKNGSLYKIVVTNPGTGYVKTPIVTVVNTGTTAVITTATVSPVLSNDTIRKNLVGIKFDRTTGQPLIKDNSAVDTFICNGRTAKFELSWLPEWKKETIVAQVDGKQIYSEDYTLEYFSKDINNYKKEYARFVFLNYVPKEGQIFRIRYQKNIDLLNVVDRFNNYYKPTDSMPGDDISLSMSGLEYSNSLLQGLPFNYTIPWNPEVSEFGKFIWDDLVETYASAKLISTATIGDNIIYLNTNTDIIVGQTISALGFQTNKFRKDTVVEEINGTQITISNPVYNIAYMKSGSLNVGSQIIVKTKVPFYGNIKKNDLIIISSSDTPEFNGQYSIEETDGNDKFVITATNLLTTTTAIISTLTNVSIPGIVETIKSDTLILEKFNKFFVAPTTSTIATIKTLTPYNDIVNSKLFLNSLEIFKAPGTSLGETPGPKYIFYGNIPYGTDSLQFVNLYQYIGSEPLKGTIYRIHGGSWRSSNIDPNPLAENSLMSSIAEQGYTIVDINYRGWNSDSGSNGNGQFPNSVNDIKTVLRFSFESGAGASFSPAWQNIYNYLQTYGKPIVVGGSAGGHLAIMSVGNYGTESGNWPKAVAVISAPLNVNYNDIFIDTLVKNTVINNYITNNALLDDASPFYQYGTLINPGPWFNSINSADCKFYFKHNKNDTLVTFSSMASPTIERFKLYNPTKTFVTYDEQGPSLGSWPGTNNVNYLGPTPDGTTLTLPISGASPGDAYFADGTFWVYNNGTYLGDSINPASIRGFTRWFDHNYVISETNFILEAAQQLLSSPTLIYSVANSGSSSYIINGNSNPSLYLVRGKTYYFNIATTGHPFWIKTLQTLGSSDAYISGVTNNGIESGVIIFTVPNDAPGILYYICQNHPSMTGVMNILNSPSIESYYEIIEDNLAQDRAVINIYNLSPSTLYTIDVELYGNPTIEFVSQNLTPGVADTELSGGSWNTATNFVGALGFNPEDVIVNGENFVSYNQTQGPEELMPGKVLDSVGINVYTKSQTSKAMIFTGAFVATKNTITTSTISIFPEASAGIMVYSNGTIFDRISNKNFTADNQFYIEGNQITIPAQDITGRIGYTIINSGGEYVLDSNIIVIDNSNTSTALVQSLAHVNDVERAYVLVNGTEINEINTTSSYGYMLSSVNKENKRACVKIYNLPAGTNTIEVWFFSQTFDTFNRVNEQVITVTSSTSSFILSHPPGNLEPVVASTIVELELDSQPGIRKRLVPPEISYYTISNNLTTYSIDNTYSHPTNYYLASEIKVFLNGGSELTQGLDYTVDEPNNAIILSTGLANNGDSLAIMAVKDNEFLVENNLLTTTNSITNATLRVITFTNHDGMLIQTETFNPDPLNKYVLSRPAYSDNYVWVYVNGTPLINRYDFEILDDMITVQLGEFISMTPDSKVIITTIAQPAEETQILGYRFFKDIFDRFSYKRLSKENTTFLTKELRPFDTEIHVYNDDVLMTPNPGKNKPGVILVDGERIEYFIKDNNVLKQLRRGTFGTGAPFYTETNSDIIDQSVLQTIPYQDSTLIQKFETTGTNTYVINTISGDTGDGITLTPGINAVDQLTVFYGGRQLRKVPLNVHDISISYNSSPISIKTLPPEFTINTSTQELILNIAESIITGTQITVVQKLGYVWTGTESLITSNVSQAEFLRERQAKLPDIYYYGGDPTLYVENYFSLTNEDDNPLEEY